MASAWGFCAFVDGFEFCVVFWWLSGWCWHEYLPAKNKVFSGICSVAGCAGCHFSYLFNFFIFFHETEYCKIDANRHQIRATGQKSGFFLLAGVGGMWCQMWCQRCHLLGLFLFVGDCFACCAIMPRAAVSFQAVKCRTNSESVNARMFVNRGILTKRP